MPYTIGVVSHLGIGPDQGGRRRNEDNYLICHEGSARFLAQDGSEQRLPQEGQGALVAVCDGMGGHADGDVAAATAVQVLRKLYQPSAPRRPARVLLKYVVDSHRQLHLAARKDGPVVMGTTLTAAWLVHGTVAWAQVGDSRMYLQRGGQLVQLTTDQTRNEFARRDGMPVVDQGERLAQNFIYGSRGLGDDAELRLEHGHDAGAEIVHPGDRLLLCTDGLTAGLGTAALHEILASERSPQDCAELLVQRGLQTGTRDNLTALVVEIGAVV